MNINKQLEILKEKEEKILPKIKKIQDEINLSLAKFEKDHGVWVLIEKKDGRVDLGLFLNPDSLRE